MNFTHYPPLSHSLFSMALHHARFTPIVACVLLIISFFDWVNASSNIDTGTPHKTFYPRGRDRPHDYKIINEEVRYSGWRKVIQRSVSAPIHPHHTHLDDTTTLITTATHDNDGTSSTNTNTNDKNKDSSQLKRKIIHFDIIDQTHTTGGAVIIFAWNTTSKTATIIREYMPGPHRILGGLAAGIVEDGKHSSMEGVGDTCSLVAARYELEEEWYDIYILYVLCRMIVLYLDLFTICYMQPLTYQLFILICLL